MEIMNRVTEKKGEALRLLTFLWAIEKGYAKPVKLRLPPDLPSFDKRAIFLDALISSTEERARDDDDPSSQDREREKEKKKSKQRTILPRERTGRNRSGT
jgi:hypothetical protein